MPSVAVIEITRRCQNNCYHCYVYRYDEDVLGINDRESEMRKEHCFKLLDLLAQSDVKEVQPLGGEPTLHPELFEIAEYARHLGFAVTTTTNAIKLKERSYARKFTDHFQSFIVTLHSHERKVHNLIVQNNAFDATVAGLKNALREGASVAVNSALCRHNAESYHETVEFLASLGIGKINLNLSTPPSGEVEKRNWHISMKRYAEKFLECMSVAREHGIALTATGSWKLCIFNPIPFGVGHYPCSIGSCLLQVDTWGNVVACYAFRERVGNIFQHGLLKVWLSEKLDYYRKKLYLKEMFPACASCAMLSSCGGPCLVGKCQVERDIAPVKKEGLGK